MLLPRTGLCVGSSHRRRVGQSDATLICISCNLRLRTTCRDSNRLSLHIAAATSAAAAPAAAPPQGFSSSSSSSSSSAHGHTQDSGDGSSRHTPMAHPAAAAYPVTSIAQQCRELRHRVCRELLDGGLIYLEGGDLLLRNGTDVHYRFRSNSHFTYVTGMERPGFAALIDAQTGHFTLLAPQLNEDAEFWVGALPSLEQMADTYGADKCCYTSDLPSLLQPIGDRPVHTLPGRGDHLKALAGSATPRVLDGDTLDSILQRCRSEKSDAEVACLLHANQVSAAAHMDMWRACRPGMTEYQLESVFIQSVMGQGLPHLGYPCIVGAGRNAAVLHYSSNTAVAQDGELVLVDAGAEFRSYTADISRTFPVNGRFSPAQRDVYNAVLSVQEHALSQLTPGTSFSEVERSCRVVLVQRLQDLGLLDSAASVEALLSAKADRVFMPHGLGHFLGLDVHDCSSIGPVPKELKPGHVVTCEPGIYFIPPLLQKAQANPKTAELINFDAAWGMLSMGGVRIEDNVFVRQTGGPFNITDSAGLPKGCDEIEAIMQQAYVPSFHLQHHHLQQ